MGVIVAFVTLGLLFAPPAVAQNSGDVQIEITESPNQATVGEEITVEASVTNDGSADDSFEISLEVNDTVIESSQTASLEPGETESIDFEYTVGQEDVPELTFAVVDDSGDERGDGTVSVTDEPQLNTIDGPPESVPAGEDIELEVEAENTGAADGTLEFWVDDTLIHSEAIDPSRDSQRERFFYTTDRRDLGRLDIRVEFDEESIEEPVTVTLPENVSFAAERTGVNEVTVTLDSAEVGETGTISEEEVTLWTGGVGFPWDLSEDESEDGAYRYKFPPEVIDGDESLMDATIELGDTELSDTVHLHTVEQTTIASWTDDRLIYIPVDTTGVSDVDEADVSVTLPDGNQLDADFEDSNTVTVDLNEFRVGIESETDRRLTFETTADGAPIGHVNSLEPDIRFLHGEVVLWHPHIDSETDYTVTLQEIDGEIVDHSITVTATTPGAVRVPEPETVAGADTIKLSVTETGEEDPLFESLEVADISEEHHMNASVIGSQTLESDHSFEQLSVSAVLVETGTNPTSETRYLTDGEFEVDGNQLSVSGIELQPEDTVQVATNAGIVNVNLNPGDDTLLPGFIVPGIIFGLVGLGGLTGGLLGKRTGLPDLSFIQALAIGGLVSIAGGILILHSIIELPIPGDVWPHYLGIFLLGMALLTGYTIGGMLHRPHEEYARKGTKTTQQRQQQVRRQISITDGNRPIREEVEIKATRADGSSPKTSSSIISGGSGAITLPAGTWRLQATLETARGEHTSEVVRKRLSTRGRGSKITIEIPLPDVSVSVRDRTRGGPIPDVSVQLEADGEIETKRTDTDGRVTFDPPLDADSAVLTVNHEKYEERTIERTLGSRSISETVELRPQTEALKGVSRIDGVEVGGMNISIQPDESALENIYGEGETITTTTSEDGSFTEDGLIVGRYRVGVDPSQRFNGHFEASDVRALVGKRDQTVTLDARFTWDLSNEQYERIRRIRSELDDVVSKSGIDTAIPQYYASVVEVVLDAVEAFPKQGHHFAEMEAHPDEVTEATLDAAADTVETISEAMSTKRNLDLFTACADMTESRVRWGGTFEIDSLVDRLQDDPMAARRSFAERADRTSERIDAERGDLSEIAPARELLERIEIDDSKNGIDSVVSIHVAILLLDAIERLFEQQQLRERLSRTVF